MGDGSIKQDLETALQQVARTQFACLPTPLMRLHNLERQLGYDGLYIKRDDLTGLGPGGNKLRSLEFIVGEAAAKGRDTLIASGPLQSNLCTLAAAACAGAQTSSTVRRCRRSAVSSCSHSLVRTSSSNTASPT